MSAKHTGVLALSGALTLGSTCAPAQTHFEIRNVYSTMVLDVPGFSNSDKMPIQQYGQNNGTNQQWVLTWKGGATPAEAGYEIRSVSSQLQKVIDVPGFSHDSKQQIEQYAENGGVNQLWTLKALSPGNGAQPYVAIQSVNTPGMVLDDPGYCRTPITIEQYPENDGLNQQWSFVPFGPHPDVQVSAYRYYQIGGPSVTIDGSGFPPYAALKFRYMGMPGNKVLSPLMADQTSGRTDKVGSLIPSIFRTANSVKPVGMSRLRQRICGVTRWPLGTWMPPTGGLEFTSSA